MFLRRTKKGIMISQIISFFIGILVGIFCISIWVLWRKEQKNKF